MFKPFAVATVRFPKEIISQLNALMARDGDVTKEELDQAGIWVPEEGKPNTLRFHMSRSVLDFKDNWDASTEVFAVKDCYTGKYKVSCGVRFAFRDENGERIENDDNEPQYEIDGEWVCCDSKGRFYELVVEGV
ncbi:MAG: hypothetical protein IKD78_07735 [Bacteroidales bacterium]|nr:hypothetical protein [Bacteroidales bacterium]